VAHDVGAGRTGIATTGELHERTLATRRGRRTAERRARRRHRATAIGSVVVLAVTIATVSVGFTARDAAGARQRATVSTREGVTEVTLARRSQVATAARLTGAATAYAATARAQALAAATAAEAAAADVQSSATTVLTGDALGPLRDASLALSAMTVGLSPDTRTVTVITVSFSDHDAPASTGGTDDRGPSQGRSVGPLLDSTASSVARSADVLRAARELTTVTAQIRVATVDAIADRDRRAAEAAAAAAAELARRVAVAATSPNGRIPSAALCGVAFAPGARLRCDAAAALDRLDAAFHTDRGGHLVVVSSYRDLADQVEVKAARGDLASAPGTSNHGKGIAVDLAGVGTVDDFTEPTYLWLMTHAASFGWDHPAAMEPGGDGPPEPWHWEFGTE
jgi:LAS superfamily LD-carboxypeptidase LdcB